MIADKSSLYGKRLLITGGAGFLGRYVSQTVLKYHPAEIIIPRQRDYDLRCPEAIRDLFTSKRPELVIHLAAVVGGIGANRLNPGKYFYDNAVMAVHLMEEARLLGVEKFVSIGTICSYPKHTSVPFREEDIWNGYPEETNAPYGIAKKIMLVQGQAYRQQYGFNAITLLPVNLYGPGDSFDPLSSHVIPAIIRKTLEARESGAHHINVWGTGVASREFLFVRDAAEAIATAADRYNKPDPVNLGSGREINIRELAELICELCGFRGEIRWEHEKPDGQPRRCLDTSRAEQEFGFRAFTSLRAGLIETIEWYENQKVVSCQLSVDSKEKDLTSPDNRQLTTDNSTSDNCQLTTDNSRPQLAVLQTTRDVPDSPKPRALITGITGQDGSYLAELLLEKGYEVHGLVRRSSSFNTSRIDHLYRDPHESGTQLFLHYGDLTDGQNITNLVLHIEPDEIYNLGAQSHVRVSFDQPVYTLMSDGVGALNVLEAARLLNKHKSVRVYQASSSEMFGKVLQTPQSETTPFNPQSPYACAKVYSYYQTINYRRSYHLFACNGILFNHESPRRGETFVTRKITRAATRIKLGLQVKLYLGNLDAKRDWGYAKDYVEAMWLMLQHDEPDDFVIATGETRTIRQFLDLAFGYLELDWHDYVEIDPRYFRPAEVDLLQGDASKARKILSWRPSTDIHELTRVMVAYDLDLAQRELHGRSFVEY